MNTHHLSLISIVHDLVKYQITNAKLPRSTYFQSSWYWVCAIIWGKLHGFHNNMIQNQEALTKENPSKKMSQDFYSTMIIMEQNLSHLILLIDKYLPKRTVYLMPLNVVNLKPCAKPIVQFTTSVFEIDGIDRTIMEFLSLSQRIRLRSLNRQWKQLIENDSLTTISTFELPTNESVIREAIPSIFKLYPNVNRIDFSENGVLPRNVVLRWIHTFQRSLREVVLGDNNRLYVQACFQYACIYNVSGIIPSLLNQGASISKRNRRGKSSLYLASMSSHTEVMRVLLQNGASIEYAEDPSFPLLQAAVMEGKIENVELLIQYGANVNATSKRGSALCVACELDHKNVVELLVEKYKANIDMTNHYGLTPLLIASSNGFTSLVEYLIDNGSSLYARDFCGEDALAYAVAGKHHKTVRLLLNRGISWKDSNEGEYEVDKLKRCIHYASTKGDLETLAVLNERITNLNIKVD